MTAATTLELKINPTVAITPKNLPELTIEEFCSTETKKIHDLYFSLSKSEKSISTSYKKSVGEGKALLAMDVYNALQDELIQLARFPRHYCHIVTASSKSSLQAVMMYQTRVKDAVKTWELCYLLPFEPCKGFGTVLVNYLKKGAQNANRIQQIRVGSTADAVSFYEMIGFQKLRSRLD